MEINIEKTQESELQCFIVYSDSYHVDYMESLLYTIETILEKEHFIPVRLGEYIRSTDDYMNKLISLIDKSVLSIVLLDGFRPNVIFEFGYLTGKQKPIILMQSTKGFINIKNLYGSVEETGLDDHSYLNLKNPLIKVGKHLSDFAGKHVAYFDTEVEPSNNNRLESKLEDELSKCRTLVIDEFKKITANSVDSNFLSEFMSTINHIYDYIFDPNLKNLQSFIRIHDDLKNECSSKNSNIPYRISDLIGTIYFNLGERNSDKSTKISSYNKAIEVFIDLLNSQMVKENKELQVGPYKKLGDIQLKLFDISLSEDDLRKGIDYYDSALKFNNAYQLNFIIYFKLATKYFRLGLVNNLEKNFQQSREYYKKALDFITIESYPDYFASANNNLGNIHLHLGNYFQANNTKEEEAVKNWTEAILCYSSSIQLFKNDVFLYANTLLNRGICHYNLAMKEIDIDKNIQLAIESFNEALEYLTQKMFPDKYAILRYNRGTVYEYKYFKSLKTNDRLKAIDDLSECVRYFSDSHYLVTAYRKLGELYVPFENPDEQLRSNDFEGSTRAYLEAINRSDSTNLHEKGLLWYNLAMVYHKWFYFDPNYLHKKNMEESLVKAKDLISESEYPEIHKDINKLKDDLENK